MKEVLTPKFYTTPRNLIALFLNLVLRHNNMANLWIYIQGYFTWHLTTVSLTGILSKPCHTAWTGPKKDKRGDSDTQVAVLMTKCIWERQSQLCKKKNSIFLKMWKNLTPNYRSFKNTQCTIRHNTSTTQHWATPPHLFLHQPSREKEGRKEIIAK